MESPFKYEGIADNQEIVTPFVFLEKELTPFKLTP